MKISVIIPCHNAARWVPFALESIFAQTKKPFEVILVDDDSNDNLIEAIALYAPAVKLIHTCKRNAAAARNEGIKVASGDWIALLDADDIWHQNHLEWAEDFLTSGNEVAYIANHDWIDLSGRTTFMPDWFVHPTRGTMRNLKPDDFFKLVSEGFHFCHSTVVYSKDLLNTVGFFDEQQIRRHDLELWLRVISNGDWAYDSRKSAGYRIDTPGSISKNELECDYFELLALRKFSKTFSSKVFKAYFKRTGRRALGIAITSGNLRHYQAVFEIVAQDLEIFLRLFYCMAYKFSPFVCLTFQLKRRLQAISLRGLFQRAMCTIARKTDSYYWKHIHYDVIDSDPVCSMGKDTTSYMGFYQNGAFSVQSEIPEPVSAILEFFTVPKVQGLILNPCIKAEQDGLVSLECYARGVVGVQFLNATPFIAQAKSGELKIQAETKNLQIARKQARLHVSNTKIRSDERVVVFGPHPDDSEIAAFGFYSDYHAKVVNISCGEATDRFQGAQMNYQMTKAEIAKFRLLDSLYAPRVGGLRSDDVMNFCYPDGLLAKMFLQPDRDFGPELDYSFSSLREEGGAPLLDPTGKVTWRALVDDICNSLRKFQPTLIVCPHPRLDCHDDHFFTTLAIFESANVYRHTDLSFFFYSNHNLLTELWPFGPANAAFSPLPGFFKDGMPGDGFFFHPLSEQRRLQKAIALEIMHDIRDINFFEPRPLPTKLRQIRSHLHAIFHRMGVPPTSYQRRGPRPHEFFVTASWATAFGIMAEAAKTRGIEIEDSYSQAPRT